MIELYSIVKQKCKSLYNNLLQIKPSKSHRFKRWDTLGSAWKWLAGNPDADDLRIINTTMNELINENNQQFQVNEQINKRIQLLTTTINQVMTSTTMANKIALTELEIMTSIMHIDTINTILEDIQDAVVRTKVALPSNRILSLKEIVSIKNLLTEQGVNLTVPDEALKFINPKVAISNETLLYILEVPKLEKDPSIILRITPLVVNDSIIENYPQHLIKNNQKLFTTTNYNNFVQRHSDIKEFKDFCIKPLVMGKQGKCNVTTEVNTSVQWISDGKILINNAKDVKLSTDCGPDDRKVTGNLLISIGNCTATINDEKFQSYDMISENEEVIGALHNIQILRQAKITQNITAISQETIRNRKRLEEVFLTQYNHRNWIWSISGGLSMSSIGIIVLVLCIFIQKCSKPKALQIATTLKTNEVSYNELLKKAGVIAKAEDDFSSPQGGVMVP